MFKWFVLMFFAIVLGMDVNATRASASISGIIDYNGGPVITTPTIYQLYYGDWWNTPYGQSKKTALQQYVSNVAAYINGAGAASNQSPVLTGLGTIAATAPTPPAPIIADGIATRINIPINGGSISYVGSQARVTLTSAVLDQTYVGGTATFSGARESNNNANFVITSVIDSTHANITPGGNNLTGGAPIAENFDSGVGVPAVGVRLSRARLVSNQGIMNIIDAAISSGVIPAYTSNTLVMVFMGWDLVPDHCNDNGYGPPFPDGGCDDAANGAYHWSFTTSNRAFGVVFARPGDPNMIDYVSHEIFEAVTDPYFNRGHFGWAENRDGGFEVSDGNVCGPKFTVNGTAFAGLPDNQANGACTTTGFITNPLQPTSCGVLAAGQGLIGGKPPFTAKSVLYSCGGGTYYLAMSGILGNLTLNNVSGSVLWATPTTAPTISATMQYDGNFTVQRGFGGVTSEVVWATNTYNYPGASLSVQSDGNLVVYSSNGIPLWARNTPSRSTICGRFNANQGLHNGETVLSCNGNYKMSMLGDGNFVVFAKTGTPPIWTATWGMGTEGSGNVVYAVMQPDGNFVLYNSATWPATPIASSGTSGANYYMKLTDTGVLNIYDANNVVKWHRP